MQQTVIGPLKTESEQFVIKDDEKACLMNNYFATVGEKLELDLPTLNTQPLPSDLQPICAPPLSEVKLSEDSVLQQIQHLKPNKATGPDGISPKRLKLANQYTSYKPF